MVGEGIETCLAAMQATGNPAWAALSIPGLRALELPRDVRDVIVLADGDEAGEAAARDCASRWKREGAACASPARRREWISTTCCWAARPAARRTAMNDIENETENLIAERHRRGRGYSRPAGRLGRERAADPGAAFAPEVLERLAALKKEDRAAFEALRAQLKKVRVPCHGA